MKTQIHKELINLQNKIKSFEKFDLIFEKIQQAFCEVSSFEDDFENYNNQSYKKIQEVKVEFEVEVEDGLKDKLDQFLMDFIVDVGNRNTDFLGILSEKLEEMNNDSYQLEELIHFVNQEVSVKGESEFINEFLDDDNESLKDDVEQVIKDFKRNNDYILKVLMDTNEEMIDLKRIQGDFQDYHEMLSRDKQRTASLSLSEFWGKLTESTKKQLKNIFATETCYLQDHSLEEQLTSLSTIFEEIDSLREEAKKAKKSIEEAEEMLRDLLL